MNCSRNNNGWFLPQVQVSYQTLLHLMCRKVTDTDWVYFQLFYMLEFTITIIG